MLVDTASALLTDKVSIDRETPLRSGLQVVELDPGQQRVVDHCEGPLLVLAGPGTGKTTTIVEAMASRLSGGKQRPIDPGRVLALTFGRGAADELRSRLAQRVGSGLLPTIATFHSFAFGIVRQFSDHTAFGPLRLLNAPEQEQRIREMLGHAIREGRIDWPTTLVPAIGTAGLAGEVRALLAQARTLGMSAADLVDAGRAQNRRDWVALASFYSEYLDVLDAEGVIDYSELVARAVGIAESDGVSSTLANRYDAIFVDEYQDVDSAQERLLKAITTSTTALVAVGDPDQAIYRFRGSDVRTISRFPESFPRADGSCAPITVLSRSKRFGDVIRAASDRVIGKVPLTRLPAEVQRVHRSPDCAPGGVVEVVTYDSPQAQADSIADTIRRASLHGEVQRWSDIAILLRNAASAPTLMRALARAGVPAQLAVDELPLRQQPAVRTLLDVMRAVIGELSIETAERIAVSPLCGLDSLKLRRVGRSLRSEVAHAGVRPDSSDRNSGELLAAVLVGEVRIPTELEVALSSSLESARTVIANARLAVATNEPIEEVLWQIWRATSWPDQLEISARGSGVSAASANADLDAVVQLFSLAKNMDHIFEGRRGVADFVAELDAQAITAATTEPKPGSDAVAVMTAHRAKGLQWSMVVVADVQEGVWPDLRMKSSLLGVELLASAEVSTADLIADERRLFYVACTRARKHLLVTAVASLDDAGEQPSRFIDDLVGTGVDRRHESGHRCAPLAVWALIAELRACTEDESASGELRQAAAQRLARLAGHGFNAALPDRWWDSREWTASDSPVRDPGKALEMSGSSWARFDSCSLAWFLEHEAKARTPRAAVTAFGSIVHVLADAVAKGELAADADVLAEHAEQSWAQLSYEANWQAAEELDSAVAALSRFVAWQGSRLNRELVASEVPFDIVMPVDGDEVHIRGSADRIEVDGEGHVHVVDLKTERKAKTQKELVDHRQLQIYQLAVEQGAFNEQLAMDVEVADIGGAELVQLRLPAGSSEFPKIQAQEPIDFDEAGRLLSETVRVIRAEDFAPSPEAAKCRSCQFQKICPAKVGQ